MQHCNKYKIIKIWVFRVDPIYCRYIDLAERVRYMTCRLTSDISTKEFHHYSQDPCSAHHAVVAWQHFMLLCILHKPWAIEFLNTPIQIYNFNWKSQEGGNSQFTHILTWIQWSLRLEICYSPFFLLLPFSVNCPSNQQILTLAIFWICKSLLPRESNFWPKNTNSRAPSHIDYGF